MLPLEYCAPKEAEQIWTSVLDTENDVILPFVWVDCNHALTKWHTYRATVHSCSFRELDNCGDELSFMLIDNDLTPIICSGNFSRPQGTLNAKKAKTRVSQLLRDRPFVLTFVWYDNGLISGHASTSHMVVCVHTTAFMLIFDPLIGSAAQPIHPFVRPPPPLHACFMPPLCWHARMVVACVPGPLPCQRGELDRPARALLGHNATDRRPLQGWQSLLLPYARRACNGQPEGSALQRVCARVLLCCSRLRPSSVCARDRSRRAQGNHPPIVILEGGMEPPGTTCKERCAVFRDCFFLALQDAAFDVSSVSSSDTQRQIGPGVLESAARRVADCLEWLLPPGDLSRPTPK